MPSVINKLTVAELTEKLRGVGNALMVDFTGLKARQADALRAKLRGQGAELLVVKNSLAARALGELSLAPAAKLLNGPIALVVGGDPVAMTKLVRDWGRKEQPLAWRGAIVEGEVVDAAGVDDLAALPPLLVLRAQAVSAIGAPLIGLVGALQGVLRNVVGVLQAIADKQEPKKP